MIRTDFDDNPKGARPFAVVRGGAGWRRPVSMAGSYQGGSVRLSTVLQDLSTLSGETVIQPADGIIGGAFGWQAHSPQAPVHYEDVLADLVSRGAIPSWRVDLTSGATRFDPWPSLGSADGRGRVMSRRLSRLHRHVGLDTQVAAFLPGATLEGAAISRTILHEDAGKLSADVFLDSTITAHQSIRRVLVTLFPWLADVVLVAGTAGAGLAIRAAGGLLHLMGGPTDPAVARVGDFVVRLGLSAGVPSYSRSKSSPYAWSPIPAGTGPGGALLNTDAGAAITITTGSGKVTCA